MPTMSKLNDNFSVTDSEGSVKDYVGYDKPKIKGQYTIVGRLNTASENNQVSKSLVNLNSSTGLT